MAGKGLKASKVIPRPNINCIKNDIALKKNEKTVWPIIPLSTVLCKSNASEFRRISWLFLAFQGNFASSEIATTFPRTFEEPIVSIWSNFRRIIRCGR